MAHAVCCYIMVLPRKRRRHCTFGRRFLAHDLRKEVRDVTLTIRIGKYTVSIRVWKRKNRHSAK